MPHNTAHAARLRDAFCMDCTCPRPALPPDTRAVSPAQGDGREISVHSARSRRVPEGLRPLSRLGCRDRDAQSSAGTLVAAVPRPRSPTLPVIRERAQHKVTRKEKPGQAHQRDRRGPAAPSRPASPAPRARSGSPRSRTDSPGRAGPGRVGGPAPGAPRTPALSARGRSPPRPGCRCSLVCRFSPPSNRPRQP